MILIRCSGCGFEIARLCSIVIRRSALPEKCPRCGREIRLPGRVAEIVPLKRVGRVVVQAVAQA